MKLNFCTLFNSGYLSKGLVMFQSLVEHCKDAHLYVFAFDDKSYEFFKTHPHPSLTVISLKEFEDAELLKVKPTRSLGEYCWTCTSSTILYAIEKFNLESCTYLDADLFFYSDPKVLIDEMGDNSVLITEHRYSPQYDQSETSGIYCVQFITFKNDVNGMNVLRWWRNECITWCYARVEDGKFGDQKYLDDWTTRFQGIHVLHHLGGGLAPWNVQQYSFSKKGPAVEGKEVATGKIFNPVFYHFHYLKFYVNDMVKLSDEIYFLSEDAVEFFYKPYLIAWKKVKDQTDAFFKNPFDAHATIKKVVPASPFLLEINNMINNIKLFIKSLLSKDIVFQRGYNNFRNLKRF